MDVSLPQLLFSREEVYIHPTTASPTGAETEDGDHIAGKVFMWSKPDGIIFEWKALDDLDFSNSHGLSKDAEWTMVPDSVSFKNRPQESENDTVIMKSSTPTRQKFVVSFDIKDLKSFRRSKSSSTRHSHLIFILRCGTTYPALHFHRGGTKIVITKLREYLSVQCFQNIVYFCWSFFTGSIIKDACLYLVREHDPEALSQSFDELQLFEQGQAGDIITKFMNDPYNAAIGSFSKVTHFLRDTLLAIDGMGMVDSVDSVDAAAAAELFISSQKVERLALNTVAEAGFELVSKKCDLPPRPKVTRSMPVNAQQWSSYLDSEGRVIDVDAVREAIFRGGVDPAIRKEVWKFLLGYYPWNSTSKSRTEQRKQNVDDYLRMKLQWKSIDADQQSRFSDFRDRRSLIEKDVTRTDRLNKFYEGENNPNITALHDILLTHCMYNFDLGYVQGMSDLLAPILCIMDNEVDAFWCFVGFIKMVGLNFEKDQSAMKNQLLQLQTLLQFVDPELGNYLESHDSINMYFCFRWLLIVFKREFSFPDIMRLWEVIWTRLPCQNFHLLLCLAILSTAKSTLIENNFGFTEILKHINDQSGQIDVDAILCTAESICLQLRACRDLPPVIHNILRLSSPPGDYLSPFHSVSPSDLDTVDSSNKMDTTTYSSPDKSNNTGSETKKPVTNDSTSAMRVKEKRGEATAASSPSVVSTSSPSNDSSIEIIADNNMDHFN